MDETLADWLQVREPHDWAARDASLADSLVQALPHSPVTRVLDLGTGTGSNLRYLMPRLPIAQDWLLIDKSPEVLRHITTRTAEWAASRDLRVDSCDEGFTVAGGTLECRVRLLQQDLDLPLDAGLLENRHLVTASALLDLVSDPWIRSLAAQCRLSGAAALFALTYNGQISFDPREPEDERARDLLNAHQLRDKGLGGPAAGPEAHTRAAHWFRGAGFEVREARTDWDVNASAFEFQRQLIEGLASAAVEQRPDIAAVMASWCARRLGHLGAGRSRVIVGHHDLAAWTPRG